MTSNAEATEIFRTIADLLDLLGEKFKPEAYRRAARSIESLTEDLGAVAARHELRAIPGVGEAIAEKIEEYLRTGAISYYERLKREIPPGLVELMRLPGLGPRTARRFWVELGVEGPTELAGCDRRRPARRDERLRGEEDRTDPVGPCGRGLRPRARSTPHRGGLPGGPRARASPPRRWRRRPGRGRRAASVELGETVGDLDILVTSRDPGKSSRRSRRTRSSVR